MMRSVPLRMVTLGVAIALAGCSFAPPARPSKAPEPASYTATPTPPTSAEAAGVAQKFSLGTRAVPEWWKAYGSSELDALVDEGLQHSPSLDAARHTLESVRQQYRAQVGDALWPSLDAATQVGRQRALGLPNFGRPTNVYDVYAGQLQLSYDFDLFGVSRNEVKQAAAQVDSQSYQFDAAKRALAANIVITAVRASALAEQVSATERLSALAREQMALSGKAHKLGAVAQEDVLASQRNAASIDASLPGLRAQALHERHALAVLLGRTPDQAPAPLSLASLTLPAEVPVLVPSDLLSQRPDVLAAEAAVRAASAQVGVATGNMFPHLSLTASLGTGAFDSAKLFTGAGTIWGATAGITQPIFHGGALRAQRKAAVASYEASISQYRQTVLGAFQNVADTLTALDQDALALRAAQNGEVSARQSFDDTQRRYRLGSASYPVTLASESGWQNARVQAIQATATRLIDTAALYQAMGTPNDETADMQRGAARSSGAQP
ncbi:efflux transporter outer membrane subunit [Dyella terrae]|uniref:efflux transporter outer membrane subunit n=1 Tax=Dyella terrae TaxID=522259 RepID=UPI001EFC4D8B|nr:efflux transporter outer membrane subunit [Dyella terrae]ULU24217.1 efflux transporter outer membrane subunit [Dyella terrae]